ncbi:MAG: DUF4399 domain-containing protein [Verrucomicrobiae bacterium]|nr:DUF4399 domain-containing protein [Verrucomicrobiae bacterium]
MKNPIKITLLTLAVSASAFLFIRGNATSEEKKDAHAHAAPAANVPMGPTKRPADAKLYIISPKDGAKVKGTFTVRFGLKGMGVAPAGIYMSEEMPTGHHHLVIDSELPNLKLPFPKDEKNLHFGGGQTETTLTLAPGEHTLQLVLGDHSHIPHDPPLMSEKITITVE